MYYRERMKRVNFLLVWVLALVNYLMIHYGMHNAVAVSVILDSFFLIIMAYRYDALFEKNWLKKIVTYAMKISSWYVALWWIGVTNFAILEIFGYTEVPVVSCLFLDALIIRVRDNMWTLFNKVAKALYGRRYADWH